MLPVSISVVIPAYNYANLLPRSIGSVVSQHADDIELIVVDDGSCDETPLVLSEYSKRYPWIVSVRQANAGAAAARNYGIRLARGRHVLLLDADDELLPGALERLRQAQSSHPDAGIIIGGSVSVYPDGEERVRPPSSFTCASGAMLVGGYLLNKRVSISHSRSMFLREKLLQRPYPEHLRSREDIPVFAYLLATSTIVPVAEPLARIYKHADSLRHRAENEEAIAMAVVAEVFGFLPTSCQQWRRRYTAQQYMSLFRAASGRGERDLAVRYYLKALGLSVRQALQWSYLRKAIRLVFLNK